VNRPAYSAAFAADVLRRLELRFPQPGITPAWAWGDSTGKGVKVAIVDSGVDAAHPAVGAVAGYVAIGEDPQKTGAFRYDTTPHQDAFGHGTACAGIVRSLAPDCEIYSVKVLGAGLTGRGVVFAAGLRWAIENGMHVCNLSLGTTKKDFYAVLHELADLAYFRNVVLVTAANNMPVPSFPSVYASVISVAAHDGKDPFCFYYNPSPPVEFGAPGIDVRVPWLDGKWLTTTGNSFAAPHISGIVARILAKHPGLTPFQVKAILCALATNVHHDERQTVASMASPAELR
jgi:subtilisin family serine protease